MPLPIKIATNNPKLYYMGRFEMGNDPGPLCMWSGSAIGIRFHGTAINARLSLGSNIGLGYNRFEVIVDNAPTRILDAPAPGNLYNLASGLSDAVRTVASPSIKKDRAAARQEPPPGQGRNE